MLERIRERKRTGQCFIGFRETDLDWCEQPPEKFSIGTVFFIFKLKEIMLGPCEHWL